MIFSWGRFGVILLKELRNYRRNRFVISTMAAVSVLFIILPTIQPVATSVTTRSLALRIGLSLLYMLVIPVTMPSVVCAYSVLGDPEQGTLDPVLSTPDHHQEFLIAMVLAAFVPMLVITYSVFGIFLAIVALFAHPAIVSTIFTGWLVLVLVLFTPLLAGRAIWVGIAGSTRSRDVHVAEQLSVMGSLPPLAIVALGSLSVISESITLAAGLAAVRLAFDLFDLHVLAAMSDYDRLPIVDFRLPAADGQRRHRTTPSGAIT